MDRSQLQVEKYSHGEDDISILSRKLTEYDSLFDNTIDVTWTTTKKFKKYIERIIQSENGVILVAKIDAKIVAYLIGAIVEADEYRKVAKIAEIEELFVDAAWRSKNIGKDLINAFKNWCLAKDVPRIAVKISAANSDAIKFYLKNCFTPYDVILECGL